MARKLAIDMRDLIFAFEYSEGLLSYLDLETGTVLQVTEETWYGIEIDEDEEDWQADEHRETLQIQDGLGTRYIEIPQIASYEGYQDMEDFIITVEDDH